MAKYRISLPQLGGDFFITDGGIETTLNFHDGLDLPHFAAFDLLKTREGEDALRRYFRTYVDLAGKFVSGLVLETATWRSSIDWGDKLGYSATGFTEVNRALVRIFEEIRSEIESDRRPIVISGCVGAGGDGYVADVAMSEWEAESYHQPQVETFAGTAADLATGITMNHAEEAVGLVRAAQQAGMPVVVSFTVDTDGNLPTGQSLGDAIS